MRARLVAVLAGVSDPGNAGTVIRVADAAGAGAVIFAGDTVDPHNGKCVRASTGSLFHLALGMEPEDVLRNKSGLTIEERIADQRRDGIDIELIFPNKGLLCWATR